MLAEVSKLKARDYSISGIVQCLESTFANAQKVDSRGWAIQSWVGNAAVLQLMAKARTLSLLTFTISRKATAAPPQLLESCGSKTGFVKQTKLFEVKQAL